MSKIKRSKFKICKRYGEDFWGYHILKDKKNFSKFDSSIFGKYKFTRKKKKKFHKKILKHTYFTVLKFFKRPKRLPLRKKVEYIKNLKNKKKIQIFYGNITHQQLKKYLKNNKNKTLTIKTRFANLEKRITSVLYRSNCTQSIYHAKQLVTHKHISINNYTINKQNHLVKPNDLITINKQQRKKIIKNIKYKIRNNLLLHPYPRYLEINYKILAIIVLETPKLKDIPLPFQIKSEKLFNSLKNTVR